MSTATSPNPKTTRRPRGAQTGNSNAVKHGLYAKHFQSGELAGLDIIFAEGLNAEINLLRVVMGRLFSKANAEDDNLSIGEMSNILATLGLTATRLSSLLIKQKILTGEDDTTAAAISNALAAVVKELGIHP